MSEIKNYPIDIVKRTHEILISNYPHFEENDREVTFLMNCLLGITIAIAEAEKKSRKFCRGKIDHEFIEFIPASIGFILNRRLDINLTNQDLTNINLNVGHKDELLNLDKMWLLSKIRNCIAHQNIAGINSDGQWVGVRLWNMNNSKKDFELVFQIDELKKYTIFLAQKFFEVYEDN